MGPTHKLLGASAAYGAAEAVHGTLAIHACLIGAAWVASTLPDADLKLGIPHRGPTHTPLACASVVAVVAVAAGLTVPALAPAIAGGALIGYAMHLIADGLTKHGVPHPLWPLIRRDIHLAPRGLRFLTGGAAERALALAVVVALGLYLNAAY